MSRVLRSGLYSHFVVDGVTQLLLATEILLRRLDGDVSKQELNLVQFTTQPGTSAPQIVRGKFCFCILQQPFALFRSQPVSDANADPAHAFDRSNPGGKFRAEQPGIRRFKGNTPYGCEPQINRGRSIALEDPVPENDRSIERESWLRAVPVDEISDGAVVRSLAFWR